MEHPQSNPLGLPTLGLWMACTLPQDMGVVRDLNDLVAPTISVEKTR
jgi:hypothetical protein